MTGIQESNNGNDIVWMAPDTSGHLSFAMHEVGVHEGELLLSVHSLGIHQPGPTLRGVLALQLIQATRQIENQSFWLPARKNITIIQATCQIENQSFWLPALMNITII